MSHKRQRRKELVVQRRYEPGRLSGTWLAAAYEQVVSRHVRIVLKHVEQEENQGSVDQQRTAGGPAQ